MNDRQKLNRLTLRFVNLETEREFLEAHREVAQITTRWVFGIGSLVWALFPIWDYFVLPQIQGPMLFWRLAVGLPFLLLEVLLTLLPPALFRRLWEPSAAVVMLMASLSVIGMQFDTGMVIAPYAYVGLIVMCLVTHSVTMLRFRWASASTLLALAAYVVLLIIKPVTREITISGITWLATANFFAMIASYQLELWRRRAWVHARTLQSTNTSLQQALERQTATSEILRVISSFPSDVQPVFDAIAAKALELCGGTTGWVYTFDGKLIHIAAAHSLRSEALKVVRQSYPMPPSRGGATARAILSQAVVYIPNVGEDADYKLHALARAAGYSSIVAVPMLLEGKPIGVITVTGAQVGAFSPGQIGLLQTFADQAVIAIQNVRLFREIQEKSAQLEIANKHKSEFLANMSHELRTPLNAIIGFSEALMDRMFGDLNEKQLEYQKDINESGKHLLSLINDILDLSKIEAGRMELELSTFHLPTAISNAVTLIRERAQRHGITLGVDIDERLGDFDADERKFKQIMLNLLSNAVKFTPDGGKVDIFARTLDAKVEVAVRDTGIGITLEDQPAVFEEFRQVGRDHIRKAEGTGLGLALTKRFVELHGGAIRLESTPGEGSTFAFTLPLRQ